MNPLIQIKRAIPVFLVAIGCFGLSPTARAVNPPPDGGYAGNNTAEGNGALNSLTNFGTSNTAVGFHALFSDTGSSEVSVLGSGNTAIGSQALQSNILGFANTATGSGALSSNTFGEANTATGGGALSSNTGGEANTATGDDALSSNTNGKRNTATGYEALRYSTGSNNIAQGFSAGINLTTGSNNIDIGASGVAGESGSIRIGTNGTHTKTFIAGIFGVPITGSTVVVNSTGRLGVATSSARFKEGIQPMDKASEAILALQPVTFRYKHEFDPDGIPQFGLVAEQVEKVNPNLVARDTDGKPYTVRYEAVNAMLLNEFLKEHRKVGDLEATVAQQKKQIEALTATVQKVSEQMEANKPARRLAANDQ
jgi:hypothetical protein